MSTITVTQEGGPLRVEVVRAERITPHMQRVTFTGADLDGCTGAASISGCGSSCPRQT